MSISEERIGGFPAYSLCNGVVRLAVIPRLGGKIVSFCRVESEHEWLLQRERPYRTLSYGDDFEAGAPAGFDECFPTIRACVYPEREYPGLALPDHGELWAVPWEVSAKEDAYTIRA